ncbi:Uncharacterized protein APZ42_004844 [Daphnia magna]|uniref:Uncharacterized protein n=1 Tax=Daphnia magna TaxID=35525 RepID=A0A164GT75_9CRUS|nr:Uncharacterized protein APZ42_004844 [Daphnia magna]
MSRRKSLTKVLVCEQPLMRKSLLLAREWKIRPEVLAEENSSLKDKVKLLEEALLVQKAASDDVR